MQTPHKIDSSSGWIIWILGFIVFGLMISIVASVLSPHGRVSCDDFHGSWKDARNAYNAGAYWLDGNDKDGVPCEELLTYETK